MDDVPQYTDPVIINNIQKVYPNMITIKIYNEPLYIRGHLVRTGKRKKKAGWVASERSVRRSHQLISDYVLSNDFDLFCTFTFDPEKFPKRELFTDCMLRMQMWIHSQKSNHSPNLKYLIIPEHHKDGRGIHFHALLANYKGHLRDSGHIHSNKPVFNISGWRFGFSTAQFINKDDTGKVSRYVRKYITKESISEFGQHRFLKSNNLQKPIKSYNTDSFRNCLPLGRRKLYETEDYSMWEINPEFFQKVKKQTEEYSKLVKERSLQNYIDHDKIEPSGYIMSHNN